MTGSPIVAGHFAIWDNEHEPCPITEIPPHWHYVRFDTMDHLYITPFVVVPKPENNPLHNGNKSFPMFGHFEDATPSNRLGSRKKRFEWVVEQARIQNPNIKISVTQFLPKNMDFEALITDEDRDRYTTSVVELLAENWLKKTARGISLRINGYDCDFENGNEVGNFDANVVPQFASIFQSIRVKINKHNLSAAGIDRPEYPVMKPVFLSITPATTLYLNCKHDNGDVIEPFIDLSKVIDYVNMQNYDGGAGTFADSYISAIPNLHPSQILVGISSEDPKKNAEILRHSFNDAVEYYKAGYEGKKYGGIWNWKLNSEDWVYGNITQIALFNRLHNNKGKLSPTQIKAVEEIVEDGWSKNTDELAEKYTLDFWKKNSGFRHH